MTQRWETLTFLHWAFRPEVVQALLPSGLQVDLLEGQAWVGLVPFRMSVGPATVGAVPWLGRFEETNVRTYVTDASGRPGIWFFSLDAARLAAVVAGRGAYELPYFWADMDVSREGDVVRYQSRRRWPGGRGAASRVEVRVGRRYEPTELSPLEHLLTARWTLFSSGRHGLRYADAEHERWPLRQAEVLHVEDELLRAAGLPQPAGAPLAHFSDGVTARIGTPHRVSAA